ncbi:MAG: MFS transporter [Lentisphaerota bacterium]
MAVTDKKNKIFGLDYRWFLVYMMLLGSVVNYLDRANLSIANTTISAEFGLSPIQMGLMLSAFMWPYAIANLPAGWFIDKFGINKIFIFGIILWSCATIGGGFAAGFATLYISRVVLGIAEAPFFIIGGKITQKYFSEKERGIASSIINLGPKIAQGFAPPLLTFMLIYLGWRWMFISLGMVGFLVAIFWMKFYRKDDDRLEQIEIAKLRETTHTKAISCWKLFNHPSSWWFNIGNIGSSYIFWFYFTWLPTYLIQGKHISLANTAWLTSIPFLAGILAVPAGGYISDYLIKKGMSAIKARLIPTVGGCFISGLAILPVNYIDNTLISMLLVTISFFAIAMRVGVLWALVGDITPKEAVGTFGGIQNFASFIGGTLAPIGTGFILAFFGGNYNFVFIVCGILAILSAVSYALIRRPITSEEIAKA